MEIARKIVYHIVVLWCCVGSWNKCSTVARGERTERIVYIVIIVLSDSDSTEY